VTEELADRLVRSGLDFITVSLAAGRSDLQRESKPGAELGKILGAIRRLKLARKKMRLTRPLLAASFELTHAGLATFDRAVKLLKKAGVERIIGIHPLLALTTDQQTNLLTGILDEREKNAALRAVRRAARAAMWRSISFYSEPLEPEIMPVCREDPLGSLFVGASGEISPCVFLGAPVAGIGLSMGNLTESGMADIWNAREYSAFRQAYLARKADAAEKGPLLRGELESPLPAACRGCIRALGY
jgi:MoaA/NifB/PqqE/SkfB family radical SAM enzyme